MVHLTDHLMKEVKFCDPIYLQWMYQFIREIKSIKCYGHNQNCPEGCFIECNITKEALEYYAKYLSNYELIGLPTCCLIDFIVEIH